MKLAQTTARHPDGSGRNLRPASRDLVGLAGIQARHARAEAARESQVHDGTSDGHGSGDPGGIEASAAAGADALLA
jgi:hypothetical protein